jgi:NADPH:quinone reductase-like Zn-dependent oxidoreductase
MPALSEGKIRPIIDRSFPLADLALAQAHVEADHHVGKVVIRM